MIWFCYVWKKNSMGTPFLQKLGQKMVIFSGFSKKILELLDFN